MPSSHGNCHAMGTAAAPQTHRKQCVDKSERKCRRSAANQPCIDIHIISWVFKCALNVKCMYYGHSVCVHSGQSTAIYYDRNTYMYYGHNNSCNLAMIHILWPKHNDRAIDRSSGRATDRLTARKIEGAIERASGRSTDRASEGSIGRAIERSSDRVIW